MVAHNRVGDLIGSQVIWHLYQAAMTFTTKANDRILNDYVETIRLKLINKIAVDPKQIFSEAHKYLGELDSEGDRFAVLSRAIHKISQNFERQKELTFDKAAQFSRNPDLQKLLAHLKRELKDDLVDFIEPA
jgi:hypothetical protein